MGAAAIVILWFGVAPGGALERMRPATRRLVDRVNAAAVAPAAAAAAPMVAVPGGR